MSVNAVDERLMRRALELAERARGLTSPNPLVGAVVVSGEGQIVGEGFHAAAGRPHAEIERGAAAGGPRGGGGGGGPPGRGAGAAASSGGGGPGWRAAPGRGGPPRGGGPRGPSRVGRDRGPQPPPAARLIPAGTAARALIAV